MAKFKLKLNIDGVLDDPIILVDASNYEEAKRKAVAKYPGKKIWSISLVPSFAHQNQPAFQNGQAKALAHIQNKLERAGVKVSNGLEEVYSENGWTISKREVPEKRIQEFFVYKDGKKMATKSSYPEARRFVENNK